MPATAAFLVDLLRQAGVPENVLRMLPGGPQTGQELAAHSDVCGVLFTGSTRNGIAISKALGGEPEKIVALNMGGNNPVVVWDAPDISAAATIVVQSAFGSSGQHCTSARRLIVRDSLAGSLIAEIRKITDRLIIDHPHASIAPFMGPVVNDRAADGLTESFLYLLGKGGRPIKHPVRPHGALPFLAPSIIDVTDVSERPDIELFGPVLQVIRVEHFEAAIAQANASRYALCASLIGGSPEQYNQFWSNVRAGVINWNRPTTAVSDGAPFGGVGVSGNHRPAGRYSADFCAYPVASSEVEQVRAAIGIGLRAVDTSVMGD
jgi:succinylglutamic semialdehyde dehydrogenase